MIRVDQTAPEWPLARTNDRHQTTRGTRTGRRMVTTQAEELPDTPPWPALGLVGPLSTDHTTGQDVIPWDQPRGGRQRIWRQQGPRAALPPSRAGT